jgi:putative transposase
MLSHRGNCRDNAVAAKFIQLLKRQHIKQYIYSTRDNARSDIVDYIEMSYDSKRPHSINDRQSPVEYEIKFTGRQTGIWQPVKKTCFFTGCARYMDLPPLSVAVSR